MVSRGGPFAAEIRGLYLVAMAVFVVTVSIGIVNGLDLIPDWPDRSTLLTHVHAGTLGWISLSVLATSLWLFGGDGPAGLAPRALAWGLAIAVPCYVAAFFIANPALRAITGATTLALIAGWLAWTFLAYSRGPRTAPRLAFLAGIATLTYGAVVGVLIQVQYAAATVILSGDAIGAHVAAMAFSYLVLIGMGVVEWQIGPGRPGVSRGAWVQFGALFAGGIVLSVGALAGQLTAAGGLNTLAELVGVGFFVTRLGGSLRSVDWLTAGAARHIALAGIFVVVDILILVYLIVGAISGAFGSTAGGGPDFSSIPAWLVFALDHAIFIGVMTNAILGLVRTRTAEDRRWRAADHLVFFGMNVGLVGFVVGLAIESPIVKEVFSPIMGVSILVGLGVGAARLWGPRPPTNQPLARA